MLASDAPHCFTVGTEETRRRLYPCLCHIRKLETSLLTSSCSTILQLFMLSCYASPLALLLENLIRTTVTACTQLPLIGRLRCNVDSFCMLYCSSYQQSLSARNLCKGRRSKTTATYICEPRTILQQPMSEPQSLRPGGNALSILHSTLEMRDGCLRRDFPGR